MLLEQNLPRMSGFSKVTRNIGSVRNRGFEISVGGLIIDKKDFSWNATINFSANQSKVLSLGTENQMLESRPVGSASGTENVLIKEGYPLGLFYGLQMEGIRSNWYSVMVWVVPILPGGMQQRERCLTDSRPLPI